jgi:uncharacterized protein YceK
LGLLLSRTGCVPTTEQVTVEMEQLVLIPASRIAICIVSAKSEFPTATQGKETVRRLALLLVLGSLVVAGSGCGTVLNFFNGEGGGPKQVYGGVQIDCQAAAGLLKDHPGQGIPYQEALWAFFDLPFSLLGDTLTLPLVLLDRLDELSADRPIAVPQPAPPPPIAASPATNRW